MTSPENPPVSREPGNGQAQTASDGNTTSKKAQERKPVRHEIRDWLMFAVTAVLVVATIIYVHYAKSQRDTMLNQTNAMIAQRDVMTQQVNASLRQTEEIKAQTNTLNESLAETRKSVNAAQKQADASMSQANTSQISARTAAQSADIAKQAMAVGTRPYVGIGASLSSLNPNEPMKGEFQIFNEGNSSTEITFEYNIRLDTVIRPDFKNAAARKPLLVLPRGHRVVQIQSLTMSEERVKAVNANTLYLLIFVRGTYTGVGGPYKIEDCFIYRTEIKVFAECSDVQQN
jgi:uncharacterized protein YoxC